jgi:hypothetical protein
MTDTIATVVLPDGETIPKLGLGTWEMGERPARRADEIAALREGVARRRLQREFVARGLDSREQACRDNEYFGADDVHAELEGMLNAARKVR